MQFVPQTTVYAVTSHIGTQFGVVGLGQLGVIGIGLVHALVLTAIVYAIAYRTGAQVNPAVTIGLLVARKIKGKEAAVYIAAQIIGAVIAALLYIQYLAQRWLKCNTTLKR